MLVLTRKNRESVVIGRPDDQEVVMVITILSVEGGRVRLGFEADSSMPIHRREVWDPIHGEHAAAAQARLDGVNGLRGGLDEVAVGGSHSSQRLGS
jgi:carbon storage regulator